MRTIADIVARTQGRNAPTHCGCSDHHTENKDTHNSDIHPEAFAHSLHSAGESPPWGFGKGFPFERFPESVDPTPPDINPSFGSNTPGGGTASGKCSSCNALLKFIPGVRKALRQLTTGYPPESDYSASPTATPAVFSMLFDSVLGQLNGLILDISRACAIAQNRTPIFPDWIIAKPVYEGNNPFTSEDDVLSNFVGTGLLIRCAATCPKTIRIFCDQVFGVIHDVKALIERRVQWTSKSLQTLTNTSVPYVMGLTESIAITRIPKIQLAQLALRLECPACALKLDPSRIENFSPADESASSISDDSFNDSL